jgi:ABC-type Zn2+ transport system substrate-binding protein/surface adhesin
MGDVHPFGNPHYWLDPGNARRIAQGIQQKLTSMRTADAAYFQQRFQASATTSRKSKSGRHDAALSRPQSGHLHRSWRISDHFD